MLKLKNFKKVFADRVSVYVCQALKGKSALVKCSTWKYPEHSVEFTYEQLESSAVLIESLDLIFLTDSITSNGSIA